MASFKETLEAFEGRIQDALADMSPRDRMLAAGLVVAATVGLLGGGGWWMKGRLNTLDARLADHEETLRLIRVLAAEQGSTADTEKEIETLLQKNAGTDLSTYLEQAAERTNVRDRLDAVKEKSSSIDGNLEEKMYAVTLSKLTVEEMGNFLYELEGNGYPLKVRSFKSKTKTGANGKVLDLTLDISAFRLVEAAPAATEG